jgi:hypothetical protein
MAKNGRTPMSESVPPPRSKAFLLCDQVIVDLYSGRVTIVGILDRFDLQAFPGQTKQCMAFMQLSGGIGRCQIIIDIEDLEDGQTIARARGPGIEFPDRLSRINLIIDLPPIPLEHPGLYDLVVLSNN